MSKGAPVPTADPARQGEAADVKAGFHKELGLFDATAMVVGTMIGSGIFLVAADIAKDVGSSGWLLTLWVVTGVMTIIGGLCYAELAAMMPQAGGQYVFLREAYSPQWGFLYGWTCFLIIQTGSIAAVGVAFATFLGVLVPDLGTGNVLWSTPVNVNVALPVPWMDEPVPLFRRDRFGVSAGQLVAVVVILGLSLLNCRGVQQGKLVQNLFTVAKTLGLLVLIVLGLTAAFNPQAVEQNLANVWGGAAETERFQVVSEFIPFAGLAVAMVAGGAMVGSLFSADAWNNVTFIAGEIKEPRRNLPLSLALGTVLVIGLYLLANLAYLAALPVSGTPALDARAKALAEEERSLRRAEKGQEADAVKKQREELLANASTFDKGIAYADEGRVGTAVVEQASPTLAVPFMAVVIMISTFGCVNGMILMGARLYYAMARDGLFFQSVGHLNGRGVPAAGLIFQGIWSALLVFSGTYIELLDYVIFAVLLFYVLTVAGLFVLRRTHPHLPRPYRALGYPVLPALYVLLCAAIMIDLLVVRPNYSWPSFLIILTGIPVYFLWRHRLRPVATLDQTR